MTVIAPAETTGVAAGEGAIVYVLPAGDVAVKDAIDAGLGREKYAKNALMFITRLKTVSS